MFDAIKFSRLYTQILPNIMQSNRIYTSIKTAELHFKMFKISRAYFSSKLRTFVMLRIFIP